MVKKQLFLVSTAISILFFASVVLSTFNPTTTRHNKYLHSEHIQFKQISPRNMQAYRGGGKISEYESSNTENFTKSIKKDHLRNVLGVWGIVQILSILANAIKRLIPIALQPIFQSDITTFQWIIFSSWSLYMAYAEGYKGFHLKFSPMVVERAFNLHNNPSIVNYIFAGPYSMGLFGASRKRMVISWAVTIGIFSLVKIVKLLPYPYRSIVDAGVVVGLTVGFFSICWLSLQALLGRKSPRNS